MTFAQAVRTCLRRYATFSGRAPRPEYWYFALFGFLGSLLLGFVDSALFGDPVLLTAPGTVTVDNGGPIASVFGLAILIPSLAVGWRRMHDTGRSGLYLLYPLIVLVGIGMFASFAGVFGHVMAGDLGGIFVGAFGIVLMLAAIVALISPFLVIWWLTRPSQPGPNVYGPNPREVSQ
ncbi:DUF805 domain-containing protein [Sulfitobacter alexandrii]|uniref:DUF805 domain-containing protein n=1 Tax=Sulfitobacter alexandrii TaxID=1917485 RepID=A0A1J0WJ54_9RHOB|nr:DUF805 domain-containing protein [Sulfitobacter alexandrii]APE44346.1 DUF805 domain-containing protein [Sulfitobacter alexandrii]